MTLSLLKLLQVVRNVLPCPLSVTTTKDKHNYEFLDDQQLQLRQLEALREVSTVLEITRPLARALLMKWKWDTPRLIEVFFDKGKEVLFNVCKT